MTRDAPTPSPCPDEEDLVLLAKGSPAVDRSVATHVSGCEVCSKVVAELRTVTLPDARSGEKTPSPGTSVGRFVVLRELGRGGMGVVLLAYDPQLDRNVALKLVSQEVSASEEARRRLLSEARAMARLSHPNVVPVFDAAEADGRLFIAMEQVPGTNLRQWLAGQDRSIEEVVAVIIGASRGLAAAHEAGLIHRDVKPENILVRDDCRALVGDFGLVRREPTAAAQPSEDAAALADRDTTLAAAGTPLYMAPEQKQGRQADARADQFGLCACLYEALGTPPHRDSARLDFASAASAGLLDFASSSRQIPAWLRRAVLRGLDPDPDRRFPSMTELATALEPEPSSRRRGALWAAVAAVALLALVAIVLFARSRQVAEPCGGADERLAGIWDAAIRQSIERAFAATGRPHAGDTSARVKELLDRRTARWKALYVEACRATRIHQTHSETALERRMACLDRRLAETAALVGLFEHPDGEVVDGAAEAASRLPTLESCANADELSAELLPGDPVSRKRVADLRADSDRARALMLAGKLAEALAIVEPLPKAAETLESPWLSAEVSLLLGEVQTRLRHDPAARATLESAIQDAARAKRTELEAEGWIMLLRVLFQLAETDTAMELLPAARAAVARAGDPAALRGELQNNLGTIHYARGDLEAALATYAEGLEARRRAWGPDDRRVASSLGNMGLVLARLRRFDEARARHGEALEILTRSLGPDHPAVTSALTGLGIVAGMRGDYDLAEKHNRRALEIRERSLGPNHPLVAGSLTNLGAVAQRRGDAAAAVDYLSRAIEIREQSLGPEHPDLAGPLTNLGAVYLDLKRPGAALTALRRALAIREQALGDEHADLVNTLLNMGNALLATGDIEAAAAAYRRALAIVEKSLGEAHLSASYAVEGFGKVASARGRHREAKKHYRRAAAIAAPAHGKDHPRTRRLRRLSGSDD